jgi:glutamine amidotransferase
MQKIVVVDYGMGNLRSVAKALEFVARAHSLPVEVAVSNSRTQVADADRVVFPGQGAMPDCMRYLAESGLEEVVRRAALTKPFFGVCVGMQMLFDHSEEGGTAGLGLFDGVVKRFRPTDVTQKVPHMGWNTVAQTHPHPLWQDIANEERFYFVHSFYCEPDDRSATAATTDYTRTFTAAIARDNIFATQFHPEKSHRAGLTLYKNFLSWTPA